jgi:hypothetical protein
MNFVIVIYKIKKGCSPNQTSLQATRLGSDKPYYMGKKRHEINDAILSLFFAFLFQAWAFWFHN